MAWEKGHQILHKKFENVNQEILETKGFIEEGKAKILLYKFLKENPSFTSELISGITLFPFQHMAIKAMMETDYFLGIWCLDENEYVLSSNGFKKIKDIQVGEMVRSREQLNLVTDKRVNPLEDGLEITLQSGDSFKAKIGHKTLVFRDFQFQFEEIQNIKEGDTVPVKLGTDQWGTRDIFKDFNFKNKTHLFYWLGYVLGDGYLNQDGVHYCSENCEIQDTILKFTKANDFKMYARQRSANLNFYEYSVFNRELVKSLESIGWDKSLKSKDKIICDQILEAEKHNICAVIGGLFDADGYASFQSSNSKVGLKSTSLQMLRQVKMLLNNLGVESNLRLSGQHLDVPYYDLVLANDVSSLKKFQDEIDFIVSHKKLNLQKIIDRSNLRNYQNKLVPKFGDMLKTEGSRKKLCGKNGQWGTDFSQNEFDNLHDLSDNAKDIIDSIKEERVSFSVVKTITPCQVKSVDITVENEECYIGNGIVHHNSRGLSKCSAHDSLIHTDKGLVEIIDVNIGDSVQSANGLNKVINKTINLAEKTHIIKTRSGFTSEGLDYHRVMVLTPDLDLTWKYNKDVVVGDYIVIKRGSDFNIPEQDIFEKFTYSQHFNAKTSSFKNASVDSWYYFFGLLIGDGHINKNGKVVSITSNDYKVVEFLQQFSNEIGLGSRIVEKGNDTKEVLISSVELQEFLKFIGFKKVNAYLKTVPSKLTHNSPEAIRALLQGLFDTDGYCSIQKRKGKGTSVKIGFTSSSEKLIKQVQNLLLCQGIVTKKAITFKGGKSKFPNGKTYECRKAWSLIACNQKELRVFADKINFRIKRKADLLLELSNQIVQNESFCDYVPYVGDKLKDFFNRKSIVADYRSKYKLNFRKNSSRRLLAEILNTKRLPKDLEDKIIPLMRPDFVFEEIVETGIGECVTVDIQVENESCYVADGIINHNSFTTGIFAAMDAILNQGVYIGIISKSFRQSRMIFNKIEEIAKSPKSALLSQCITRVSKSNDQWVMEIGRSKIIALPLGDGEKLRGFRFQRMIIDELLLMPEKIINEVILPFLAVVENPTERQKMYDLETKMIEAGKMTEDERYQWPHNKIIGLSSASYKFEYLYKLYQQYENLILNPSKQDNAHRVIMHLSYDCAPKQLYDQNLLDQSKATMSEAQFAREFGSVFTDDSSGYFKVSKMAACTVPDGEGQAVEVIGDKNSEYILSFDPSWSESEGSDDFAIHVIKLNPNKKLGTIVHSYALAGASLKKHIVYFHYLYTHFNIRMIVGDYNGGVQFINSCNESEIFKKAGIQIQCIDADFDDPQNYNGDLRFARNQYNLESKKICILRKPSSQWIRSANEMLQAAFDHKKIWFAGCALDDDYTRQKSAVIPIDEISFSKYNDDGDSFSKQIDLIEHLKDTVDATKVQCALIQVATTANGSQSFDLPYNLKKQRNADKARKDSYSALVLGNWLMNIYFDMMATPEATAQTTFVPMFVD